MTDDDRPEPESIKSPQQVLKEAGPVSWHYRIFPLAFIGLPLGFLLGSL